MKASYENDSAAGPGHGKLILTEIMPPEAPLFIALQRGIDKLFATGKADGSWVAENYFIPVEGRDTALGTLEISLFPSLVDVLDPQDIYRLQLKGADGVAQRCTFTTGPVIKSDNADLSRKDKQADQSPDVEAGRPEHPAEKQPPASAEKQAPASAEKQAPASSAVKAADGPARLEMPKAGKTAALSRHWLRYAIIALLCVCCLAWFFLDSRKDSPVRDAAVSSGNQNEPEPVSVEKKVAEFFNNPDRTSESAMRLAQDLSANTVQEKDAVYRLYYYAADKENPQGLLKYAQCLDPSLPPWGSISKDGFLAWQAYSQAASQNDPGAGQSLENLEKWLVANSGQGNAEAKNWLGQIAAVKK